MSERQHYVDEMKLKLEQFTNDIEALEIKAKRADLKANDDYHQKISALKLQRDYVKLTLEELVNSADNRWNDVKAGFETTWDHLTHSINSLKKKFSDKIHS